MSFVQEGDIPAQIKGALIAESVLNKGANSFDICVKVETEDCSQSDHWRANLSGDYTKLSNRSGWTNSQVTHEKICELGYSGPDFSGWPNQTPSIDWNGVTAGLGALNGPTSAHCEKNAAGYINVKWLGGSSKNAPTAIDPATLMNMSQQMNGGQQQQQQGQQPVQQQQQQQPQQQPQQGQQMQQGVQQQPMQQQQPQQQGNGGFQQQQQAPQNGGFSN